MLDVATQKRLCGIDGLIDEARIGHAGVELGQWHGLFVRCGHLVPVGGQCPRHGCLVGKGVDVESQVIVGEEENDAHILRAWWAVSLLCSRAGSAYMAASARLRASDGCLCESHRDT